jgi:hypothetical protein
MNKQLFAFVEETIGNYESGSISLVEGLNFNMFDTLKTIEFYSNSRYRDGQRNARNQEKPFYNIVNANVDVAITATDIDTKDIVIVGDNADQYVKAMILTRSIYEWMKEINYAQSLNRQGEIRARYGGILVKKVEQENDLFIDVPEWKNLIVDPVDIEGGVVIERHFMSAADLSKKSDSWDNINEALKLVNTSSYNKGDIQSTPVGFIQVLEVSGELPETIIDEDGDEFTYVRQQHFIATDGKNMVSMFGELQDENPYKFLPWKEVSGRALGQGIVEEGFQSQIWTNDAVIAEQEAMQLSGKVILKTDDDALANNIFEVDNGHVFTLQKGKDVSSMNLLPSALPQFQNLITKWQTQFDRTTAVTDSLRGETPPSGQALRSTALVTQQASSQFDYRREEMGILQKQIFTDWVIPFLISKRLSKASVLTAQLSSKELDLVDESIRTRETNQIQLERVLAGDSLLDVEGVETLNTEIDQELAKRDSVRTVGIPKDYFKDFEFQVTVRTTGEQGNKAARLESLSNILQTAAANPAVLQDPVLSEVFGEILELSGLGGFRASQGSSAEGQSTPAPVKEETSLNLPQPEAQA